MTKLTPAQQNVVTALKEGKTIRRGWLNSTFRYADTGKAIAEPTVKALSSAGIVQLKREGDHFYLVLKDTMPEPAKSNVVELESAPQPHETVAITGVATTEPVAPPEPVTIGGTTGLYETITTGYLEGRGNYYQRLAKAGKITITTLDGMSITRARVVAGKVEVLERGGCWHVIGRNDTLIVAGV